MSTAQLLPNGTVTTYGTVAVSAGTVHAALASGSGEYVTLDNWAEHVAPSYVLVDMGTFTLPPGGVIVSILNTAYASGQTQAGGAGPYLYLWRYGSNARTKTAATTASYVLYNTPDSDNAGVPPSTQADIDNYQLYIYLEPEDSLVYVQYAYVTVTYIGLPTLVVSQPAGGKTASAQTVTWNFTKDTSSPGGQTKFQVRVFNAAQYGIGGFDPATSPATYDSGVVASATSSHAIPAHVMRPATYRCYVRAATTNSGLDQWSTWANSIFSITLKSLNTWDAAAFSVKPVKTWNGTAFVEAVGVKIWNGTAWVNAVNG